MQAGKSKVKIKYLILGKVGISDLQTSLVMLQSERSFINCRTVLINIVHHLQICWSPFAIKISGVTIVFP